MNSSSSPHLHTTPPPPIKSSASQKPLPLTLQNELLHFISSLHFPTLSLMMIQRQHQQGKGNSLSKPAESNDLDHSQCESEHSTDNASPDVATATNGAEKLPSFDLLNTPDVAAESQKFTQNHSTHQKLTSPPATQLTVTESDPNHPLLSSQFNYHISNYVSIVLSFINYLHNNYAQMMQFVLEEREFDMSEMWKGNILQEVWQKIGILRMNAERVLISLSATYYAQYSEYLDAQHLDTSGETATLLLASGGSNASQKRKLLLHSPSLASLLSSSASTERYSVNDSVLSGGTAHMKYIDGSPMSATNKGTPSTVTPNKEYISSHRRSEESCKEKSNFLSRFFPLSQKWNHRLELFMIILSSTFWMSAGITRAYKLLVRTKQGQKRPVCKLLYSVIRLSNVMKSMEAVSMRNVLSEGNRALKALMALSWTGGGMSLFSMILIRFAFAMNWNRPVQMGTDASTQKERRYRSKLDLLRPHNLGSLLFERYAGNNASHHKNQLSPASPKNDPNTLYSASYNLFSVNNKNLSPIHSLTGLLSSPKAYEPHSRLNDSQTSLESAPVLDLTPEEEEEELKKESFTKVLRAVKHQIDLMDRMERILRFLNERILFYDASSSPTAAASASPSAATAHKMSAQTEVKIQQRFLQTKAEIAQFGEFLKQYQKV